jgi:arginine decarboxylase
LKFNFPVIIVDRNSLQSAVNTEILAFINAIRAAGLEVVHTSNTAILTGSSQKQAQASAVVITLNDVGNDDVELAAIENLRTLIRDLRSRNEEIPIFLYSETRTSEHVPNEILIELHGFIHMHEDTPEFVAKQVVREAKAYLERVAPPFFKALLHYAENGSYSWHCPGHSGGVAFLKAPAGQMFHQFFGENMLRADVCNAVEDLGQLLDHTGAAAAAEKNAARIFGADHLFFVTNGTSTSNKIVWHSTVGPNDIVIVDRNCHKSNLHAIMMTGAIPIFLTPTRNHYGIIGPIPADEFSMESIQKKINANPFIKNKRKKPRILTLTQSTYDGVLYNVEMIKERLDGKVDALHFDEAWLPHAAFHPLYKDMHAIGHGRVPAKESMIFATQSTHKTLAGLSQASQILVAESQKKKLNRHVFNEAYLMHTSTSPQYSIIASCDVAAAMMEGAGGKALVEDSIREAVDFRSAMKKVEKASNWWFKVWGPDETTDASRAYVRANWELKPGDSWHGFGDLAEGFNMLDPIKATVLTPGLDMDGSFEESGIPASVVTKFLSEHGVVVEKCGLYSFFIMFTIGITKGRWNTLVAALQQFKDAFDKNEPLSKAMPRFAAAHPRYADTGLKDLCSEIHLMYALHDVARMTTGMYLSKITPAMKPSSAFAKMAHEQIDRVEIDDLEGQVTAVLLTPYPPGIPLLVPGERFNATIVNYLKFARAFSEMFPGFETDVHGLVTKMVGEVKKYYVDCVRMPTWGEKIQKRRVQRSVRQSPTTVG